MERLSSHENLLMLLSLGILISISRIGGELVRRINQPAVVGEILAGLLLGPTVFGRFFPYLFQALFPSHGGFPLFLDGFTTLAITLFMLVAGMDVDLSMVWRQGKAAVSVGIGGFVVPFALGYIGVWVWPQGLGWVGTGDPHIYALVMGTVFAVSALPMIAKTMMDMGIYRSNLGMLIIAVALFNDVAGFLIFAVILGLTGHNSSSSLGISYTIVLVLIFTALILTLGRWLIHRSLPWIQAHTEWPGGVLGFTLSLALLGAACTEWMGVHAILGAFMVGVAVGESSHLREHTRASISQFIEFIFAPIFFVVIGLKLDFFSNFDLKLILIIYILGCTGKLIGCSLGALCSGISLRETWAIGFGVNSRGTMEIILGLLALQYGLISERVFIALGVMGLGTSIMSGPIMQLILRQPKVHTFRDFLNAKTFVIDMKAATKEAAIQELSQVVSNFIDQDANVLTSVVLKREAIMPTGIGHGIAIPQARIKDFPMPVVTVGLSKSGIDFDAPDGEPAHIIFMILTPLQDNGKQLKILADIAKTFRNPSMLEKTLQVKSYTEFLALMNTERGA